jgi:acetone carboxylase gamma subunit
MADVTVRVPTPETPGHGAPGVGDAFELRGDDAAGWTIHCAPCGHGYGPADQDPKLGAVVRERSIADLSPLNAVGFTERLVAREFCCPSCGLLIAVNVQQRGDPIMLEWSLDPSTLAAAG